VSKPLLRVRKTGALLVAAGIAFVGALPLAGTRWALSPILLIPAAVYVWAWRAGTDVFADRLRVKALFGSTQVPFDRIAELAPDRRGQISALLDNGHVIRLTGVTKDNLPRVLAVAGVAAPDAADPDDADPDDADVDDAAEGDPEIDSPRASS
jgi:hypothetical protein